jgi:hypothetical protein
MIKTDEQFAKEIYDRFDGNIVATGKYNGNKSKMDFHCNKHNLDFQSTPQSITHTKHGCQSCAREAMRKIQIKNRTNCQYGRFVDEHPELVNLWDYSRNTNIDINDLSSKSGQKVWWICTQCGEPYQSKVCHIVNSSCQCICANCNNKNFAQKKVKSYLEKKGSFADHYPHILEEWDYELNQGLDPFNFTDKSNQKVWWKCKVCGHKWKTNIAKRTEGKGCPYCARHTKSDLQIKIEDYIRNTYDFELLNEHSCTLNCSNPKTGYRLLYDNEVCISDDIKLIVECHGQQHYEICGWTYTQAKAEKCSPDDILHYQQWKDKYKKQFAISQGYHYLEIPYWTESDESYKTLIYDEIHKILHP